LERRAGVLGQAPRLLSVHLEPLLRAEVHESTNVVIDARVGVGERRGDTALRVAGVAGMGSTPGGVNRWLRRTPAERGIQMLIDDQTVTIDVYIVVNAECNLREVSQNVQKLVARDIEDNVGMHIGNINVHIEDVVFDAIDERERTS